MKAKLLTFMFAALFLVSLVSAGNLSVSAIQYPATVDYNDGSFNVVFNLTSTGPTTIVPSYWTETIASNPTTYNAAVTSFPASTTLSANVPVTLTIPVSFSQVSSLGTISGTITANNPDPTGTDAEVPFTVSVSYNPALTATSVASTLTQSNNKTTLTITNTGNADLTGIALAVQSGSDFSVSFSGNNFNLDAGESKTIDVELLTSFDDLEVLNTATLSISATQLTSPVTVILTAEKTYSNTGDLRVGDIDVTDVEGYGDDEEWYLFDEVEIEITIENKNSDDKIKDIEVQWGLYDPRAKQWIIELQDESDFSLKKKSDKVLTVSFKLDEDLDVDLEDMEDGKYLFYVIAEGVNDETEDIIGASDTLDVEIIRESDFMILTNFNMPEIVSCGETFEITADIWNLGDDETEEVYVRLTSSKLGLDEDSETFDEIKVVDNEEVSFLVEMPKDIKEGFYELKFTVYDEDGVFENDEDDAVFSRIIEVKGSCIVPSTVKISAALDSEAVAGKEVSITATLENTDSIEKTYQIVLANYDSWAELVSVSAEELTLDAGESGDIVITLKPNKDVSGNREFTIQTVYNGVVEEQRISIPVQPKKGWFTGNASLGSIDLGDNALIWVLGIAILILIILIIVVAVRLSRSHDDE